MPALFANHGFDWLPVSPLVGRCFSLKSEKSTKRDNVLHFFKELKNILTHMRRMGLEYLPTFYHRFMANVGEYSIRLGYN